MDGNVTVLKNAHVIDTAQGLDGVMDVIVAGGKIGAVGRDIAPPAGARAIDLGGHYLTPGWVDIHVHAYGTLGFGDPDKIGIYQGVTSFVDAGGTGIKTVDECYALMADLKTGLYVGPLIFPMGIVGLDYLEKEIDIRSIEETGIQAWRDWMAVHPGQMLFVKVAAYSPVGVKPLELGKRFAKQLGLPLYMHIGENHVWPDTESPFEHAFGLLEAGDIVTHCFHGAHDSVLEKDGSLRPCVKAAMERGVLFDIGFGNYGFSWEVAGKAIAHGLKPHFISSDLQQFNVLHPVLSLANVMSICLALGLTLQEVIAAVTSTPADRLALADRVGSLREGMPADLTVFRLEDGAFELSDGFQRKRTVATRFAPVMAFKNGERFECDLELAQDEENWFMHVSEDGVPEAAAGLSARQIRFIGSFAAAIESLDWTVNESQFLDLPKATLLQERFNAVRLDYQMSYREALYAVYDCFMENRFPMQIGLLLIRMERAFALARLKEVAGLGQLAAA